ncbi:hypothetical protein LCGC14_2953760, partial [marine sediment metagenome]
MAVLQIGHAVTLRAHCSHAHRWPHGIRTTALARSQQIAQSSAAAAEPVSEAPPPPPPPPPRTSGSTRRLPLHTGSRSTQSKHTLRPRSANRESHERHRARPLQITAVSVTRIHATACHHASGKPIVERATSTAKGQHASRMKSGFPSMRQCEQTQPLRHCSGDAQPAHRDAIRSAW